MKTTYLYISGFDGSFLIGSDGIVTDTVTNEAYAVFVEEDTEEAYNEDISEKNILGSFSDAHDLHNARVDKAFKDEADMDDMSLLAPALCNLNLEHLEKWGKTLKALEEHCNA